MEGNENGNPLAALILDTLGAVRNVTLQRAMKWAECGILHSAERPNTSVPPAGFRSFRGFCSALTITRWRSELNFSSAGGQRQWQPYRGVDNVTLRGRFNLFVALLNLQRGWLHIPSEVLRCLLFYQPLEGRHSDCPPQACSAGPSALVPRHTIRVAVAFALWVQAASSSSWIPDPVHS